MAKAYFGQKLQRGSLGAFGYRLGVSVERRSAALKRAVRAEGWLPVYRKLVAVRTLNRRRPEIAREFGKDAAFVKTLSRNPGCSVVVGERNPNWLAVESNPRGGARPSSPHCMACGVTTRSGGFQGDLCPRHRHLDPHSWQVLVSHARKEAKRRGLPWVDTRKHPEARQALFRRYGLATAAGGSPLFGRTALAYGEERPEVLAIPRNPSRSKRACSACGYPYLTTYDTRSRRYYCMSRIMCDERRAAWYAKHSKTNPLTRAERASLGMRSAQMLRAARAAERRGDRLEAHHDLGAAEAYEDTAIRYAEGSQGARMAMARSNPASVLGAFPLTRGGIAKAKALANRAVRSGRTATIDIRSDGVYVVGGERIGPCSRPRGRDNPKISLAKYGYKLDYLPEARRAALVRAMNASSAQAVNETLTALIRMARGRRDTEAAEMYYRDRESFMFGRPTKNPLTTRETNELILWGARLDKDAREATEPYPKGYFEGSASMARDAAFTYRQKAHGRKYSRNPSKYENNGHLRSIVGRLHVGQSDAEVMKYVASRLAKGINKQKFAAVMRAAVAIHAKNRQFYGDVMGGRFGRSSRKKNTNERDAAAKRKAYLAGRRDALAGKGLYYSGPLTPEYLRGVREAHGHGSARNPLTRKERAAARSMQRAYLYEARSLEHRSSAMPTRAAKNMLRLAEITAARGYGINDAIYEIDLVGGKREPELRPRAHFKNPHVVVDLRGKVARVARGDPIKTFNQALEVARALAKRTGESVEIHATPFFGGKKGAQVSPLFRMMKHVVVYPDGGVGPGGMR